MPFFGKNRWLGLTSPMALISYIHTYCITLLHILIDIYIFRVYQTKVGTGIPFIEGYVPAKYTQERYQRSVITRKLHQIKWKKLSLKTGISGILVSKKVFVGLVTKLYIGTHRNSTFFVIRIFNIEYRILYPLENYLILIQEINFTNHFIVKLTNVLFTLLLHVSTLMSFLITV